ncbi:MAG TPA: envelope stress response membrane protein PspC [Stellaceae bacterium]|nr:envelope stress response membrane protein PspC [Stellaceae bacterium]
MADYARFRLYRDPAHGALAGVCAGIASYFGIERVAVRLAFVLALIFFFVPAVLGYVVLAFALPKRPPTLYASGEEEAFWRSVATAPDDTLAGIRRRFGDLEARLRLMEGHVVTPDFELKRKFRDL